jgi:predicted small secreted protein
VPAELVGGTPERDLKMSLTEKLVAAANTTRGIGKRRARPWRVKTTRSKIASESNTAVMCDDLADWSAKVDARGLTLDASSVDGAILAVRGSAGSQEYFGVWNQAKAHGWVDNSGYATVEELFTRVQEAAQTETAVTSYFNSSRYDSEQEGSVVRVFPKDPADWSGMLEIYGGLQGQASGAREVEDLGRAGIEFDLAGFDDGSTLPPSPAAAVLSGAEGFAGGYGAPEDARVDQPEGEAPGPEEIPGEGGPRIVIIVMQTESTRRGLRRRSDNVLEANMEDCIEVQSYTGWLAMVRGVGKDVEISGDENGATAKLGKDDLGAWNGEKGVFNHMVQVPEVEGAPWSEPDTRPGKPNKLKPKTPGGYGVPVKESDGGQPVQIPAAAHAKILQTLKAVAEFPDDFYPGDRFHDYLQEYLDSLAGDDYGVSGFDLRPDGSVFAYDPDDNEVAVTPGPAA